MPRRQLRVRVASPEVRAWVGSGDSLLERSGHDHG